MVEIKPSSELKNKPWSCLLVGPPGGGKTHLLTTAKTKKVLVVIFGYEAGPTLKKCAEEGRNVDTVEIHNEEELRDVFMKLSTGEWKYDAIGLDSLTEMQELLAQEILRSMNPENPPESLTLQQQGLLRARFRKIVRRFRGLPLVTIFIGHTRWEMDDNKQRIYSLELVGKIANELPAMFNSVGFMMVSRVKDKVKREIMFLEHPNYPSKDWTGKVAPFEEPNLETLLSKTNGAVQEKGKAGKKK